MNTRMSMLKEIAIKTDASAFRRKTKELGNTAATIFSEKHTSQVKGLENIANSALKVSDVLDYIKRQTGRAKANEGWKREHFGQTLLEYIEDNLTKRRDEVCQTLHIEDDAQKLEVYLLLIREFVKQLVIHYEYKAGR